MNASGDRSPRSVSPPTYRDNSPAISAYHHHHQHHSLINDDRKENNNMSKDSLLSQALEKPLMGNFMQNMRTGSDGHDDSGASDTGSERPESMTDIKSDASELHRQLSSPAAMAAAAQAAAAGLFPPGLEALYRQAGKTWVLFYKVNLDCPKGKEVQMLKYPPPSLENQKMIKPGL